MTTRSVRRRFALEWILAGGAFFIYQAAESLALIPDWGVFLSLAALLLIASGLILADRFSKAPTLKPIHRNAALTAGFAFAGILIAEVLIGSLTTFFLKNPSAPNNQQTIIQIAGKGGGLAIWAFIVGSLLAPVIEEVIFRRFLIGTKDQPRRLFLIRTVASILLFMTIHIASNLITLIGQPTYTNTVNTISGGAVYLCLSLVFTGLYVKTGNLSLSILTHVLNNTFALTLIFLTL